MVCHLHLSCSAAIHLGLSGRYMDQAIGDWHGARLSDQEPGPCTQAKVSASILRAHCKLRLAAPLPPGASAGSTLPTAEGLPGWLPSAPVPDLGAPANHTRQCRCRPRRSPNDSCPVVCHNGQPHWNGLPAPLFGLISKSGDQVVCSLPMEVWDRLRSGGSGVITGLHVVAGDTRRRPIAVSLYKTLLDRSYNTNPVQCPHLAC